MTNIKREAVCLYENSSLKRTISLISLLFCSLWKPTEKLWVLDKDIIIWRYRILRSFQTFSSDQFWKVSSLVLDEITILCKNCLCSVLLVSKSFKNCSELMVWTHLLYGVEDGQHGWGLFRKIQSLISKLNWSSGIGLIKILLYCSRYINPLLTFRRPEILYNVTQSSMNDITFQSKKIT